VSTRFYTVSKVQYCAQSFSTVSTRFSTVTKGSPKERLILVNMKK
jgi:hypothetical protein